MAGIKDIAKQLNKEFESDSFMRQSTVVPGYKRLSSKALGMDYPLFGGLPLGRICVYSGKAHSGKSQPLDSLVLSSNGFIKMKDITIGTKVFGEDGNLYPVIGIYPQGKLPVYKISFLDGTSTECSANHLWNIIEKGQEKTVDLNYLINKKLYNVYIDDKNREHHKYLYKIPVCKPIKYEKKDLPIDPYILGCLLGDGCLSDIKNRTISFTNIDKDIIARFNSLLSDINMKLSRKYCHGRETNDYSIISLNDDYSRNYIIKQIIELGLAGTKSDTKFIPNIYKYSSIEDRINLLQGLMDTDGYIDQTGYIDYSTSSIQLCNDIKELIESLGGLVRITQRQGKYKNNGTIKITKISYTISFKLPKSIESQCVSCNRKLVRLQQRLNNNKSRFNTLYRSIVSIELLEDKECQCIYIDSPSHLYLTNDFIVTHNTTAAFAELAAYQKAFPDKTCVFVDAEQSCDLEFQALMNDVDLSRLFLMQPDVGMSGEQILASVLKLQLEADDIGLIVLDSIPALVTAQNLKNDFEKDTGKQGTIAKALHKWCGEILPSLRQKENILILINQVRVKDVMYNGAPIYSEPGGDAPKFYSSVSVRFGTRKFMKGDDELSGENAGEGADGFKIIFSITKNKSAPCNRGGGFITYRYETGMDITHDLLEIATSFGFINKLNSKTYALVNLETGDILKDENGDELKGYRKTLIDYINTHKEFKDKYLKMLTEYISSSNTTKLLTAEENAEIKTEEGLVEKG